MREADVASQRLQEQMALHEQGTLFEITLAILSASADVDDLMRRVSAIIVGRHRYDHFAIFLVQSGAGELRPVRGGPIRNAPLEVQMAMAREAARRSRPLLKRTGGTWRIAAPVRSDSTVLGVMVAGSDDPTTNADRALVLCEALAAQLALGIQNVNLRRRQLEVAADEERARIAHEIHDGVAQTMYALNLGIENCARLAQRGERSRLNESLTNLVPLSRQTLLEIRHYIYDLTPLLSEGNSFEDLLKKQVGEFEAISQIPARVEIRGESRPVPVPVRAGIYRVLHETLSNVLKHSMASKVRVTVSVDSDSVRMSVKDNGKGFNPENTEAGYGLENMRRRAEELGGTFEISSAVGVGTEIRVRLSCPDVTGSELTRKPPASESV